MAAKRNSGSSGKRGRSASTGRFIKQSTVRRNPGGTINETVRKKKR